MSRVALSRDQLNEINSFLDAELASVGDENSVFFNSHYSKNSYIAQAKKTPSLTNPNDVSLNTQPL